MPRMLQCACARASVRAYIRSGAGAGAVRTGRIGGKVVVFRGASLNNTDQGVISFRFVISCACAVLCCAVLCSLTPQPCTAWAPTIMHGLRRAVLARANGEAWPDMRLVGERLVGESMGKQSVGTMQ